MKDDDPTALKNVLRNIYDLPVEVDPVCTEKWREWLHLRMTADKYLEPKLSATADENFRESALECTSSDEIFDIIETIKSEVAHDESLVGFGEKMRRDNLDKLIRNDRYRAQLDSGGKEAIWQQLDELIFAADLVKKRYHLCTIHRGSVYQEECARDAARRCELCPSGSGIYGYTGDLVPGSAA